MNTQRVNPHQDSPCPAVRFEPVSGGRARKMYTRRVRREQEGYALLLVLVMVALVAIGTITLTPLVITQGQREKEDEMIWRGKQYARGVKLYFLKTHHFPASLEDLTKPHTGLRFMRQAYKDPMNSKDGSWRVIYVGPNGQLIGSLKNPLAPGLPTQQGSQASSFGSASTGFGVNPGSSEISGTSGGSAATSEPEDRGNFYGVSGAAIVGVGSKIDKPSFRWYEKAKNYHQFEFFWIPGQDLAGVISGGASQGIGTPIGQGSTQSPISPFVRAPAQTGSPDAPPPPPQAAPN